ncbi:VOC family protein [Nocardioides carbamazepini]|uniref:VOC family protein n=1 Tax=Nocardioides carbamazepini TaxID=2854259 RepID=UPI00214A4F6C|nr:VOC family protein [Nocardioides carbamazepini]MCR1784450.1 VOC family protein [Nocardioides carbamazepini]
MTESTASAPTPGAVAWFEVATGDPDAAERFYGGLFSWSFTADDASVAGGLDYRLVTTPGAAAPTGGLFGTGGQAPGHAVFSVLVADVAATCDAAEELGGTVVSRHLDVGPGVPAFAYLRDPAGNQISIFSPPA